MVISLERSQTRQEHKHQTGKQNPEVTYSTWVKRKSKVTVIKSSQFRDPFPVFNSDLLHFLQYPVQQGWITNTDGGSYLPGSLCGNLFVVN